MVTFVEVPPDRAGDEQLRGRPVRTPAWLIRARYLAVLAVIVGALLGGDGKGLVGSAVARVAASPAAGYVNADGGHCPVTVVCVVLGQARMDLWGSYNQLFPDTQTITSSVWYAPATGIVYRQELDAIGVSAERITLTQQRISGPDVPFGPTIDYTPSPHHAALVTAKRGPWLVTAALYTPQGVPSLLAAMQWVTSSPLPG